MKMAGGYTDDAVRGYINLAEKLVDGERIYFPHEGELDDTSIMKESPQKPLTVSPTTA